MPAEEQPRRTSKSKKVKYYTKYCVLVLICCLSIVIIPGIYLMYALNTDSLHKTRNQDYEMEFEERAAEGPLPWYMAGGEVYPKVKDEGEELKVWPEEEKSDRIENQLMLASKVNTSFVKTILMYNTIPTLRFKAGQDSFMNCPVQSCSLSTNVEGIDTADAVLFTDEQDVLPTLKNGRPHQQVWVLFLTKSPYHTQELTYPSGLINWTASYRSDSDIVTPVNKWVYYNHILEERPEELSRNFAAGKTEKVVWFVRDFKHEHNGRREYAEELQKYIDVDVFSKSRCPCESPDHCIRLLQQYKFFLAFETSHCRDYITEKFFTALRHGVLPVVMGPPPADYERSAPHNSYIHVGEFASPRLLAQYLHKLDQHDDLYNAYFQWRGTGEMIDTRVNCRLCALLHQSGRNKTYSDVKSWWSDNACLNDTIKNN